MERDGGGSPQQEHRPQRAKIPLVVDCLLRGVGGVLTRVKTLGSPRSTEPLGCSRSGHNKPGKYSKHCRSYQA